MRYDMDGIRIYRGIDQIGGIVTEIKKGDHRILIDFGANLPGTENAELNDDELVKEVFSQPEVKTDAVLFTHYHGDHTGLKNRIPEGIPMYIGRIAKDIMKIIAKDVDYVRVKNGEDGKIETPVIDRMIPYWRAGEFKDFNGIRIMPLICDHSALDAYMFVIEMNGERILYTGDFRAHGIPGEKTFEKMIREKVGRVDILITEGTMVSRVKEETANTIRCEKDLKEKAAEIFSRHKENVVLVSSTNIDSVMGFYLATPRDKAFIVDPYQARIMMTAIEAKHKYFPKDYRYGNEIYVLCPGENEYYMKDLADHMIPGTQRKPFHMAQPDIYLDKGFVMLARPNRNPYVSTGKFEERLMAMKDPHIIYSMWSGYLKGGKAEDPSVVEFLKGYKPENIEVLHTSGHAYVEDLKKLMDMTCPDIIVPMHTESAAAFKELELFADYSDNIVRLERGDVLSF